MYDVNNDGFISNGDLFQILKAMVGNNLTDRQLQELVDRTILQGDKDKDGRLNYEEFVEVRPFTVFMLLVCSCACCILPLIVCGASDGKGHRAGE